MVFVVEVEDDADGYDEDDEYGRYGGGFHTIPFELFSLSLLSSEVPS